jgi:hypothetical protein
MASVYLVHWHEAEARERAARLRRAGHAVRCGWSQDGQPGRELREELPDAVVIDLGRLPSHGRHLAVWLREHRSSRHVPLVFIEGDPEKTARLKKDLPDAVYTTWGRIGGALKKALANRPQKAVSLARPDYSGTPLPRKLGVKADSVLALVGAPADFERVLGELPPGVQVRRQARVACDVVLLFTRSRAELEKRFATARRSLAEGGGLWVAWPKKASGVATDLTEDVVRQVGLASGLVDNKVCAVDATWSGLRFLRRRK